MIVRGSRNVVVVDSWCNFAMKEAENLSSWWSVGVKIDFSVFVEVGIISIYICLYADWDDNPLRWQIDDAGDWWSIARIISLNERRK